MVDEDFNDVEPGQEGELLVRSPLVTQGYFNNPEATKAAFHDGWFCTGDIAVLRNGKFYIVDRKKVCTQSSPKSSLCIRIGIGRSDSSAKTNPPCHRRNY